MENMIVYSIIAPIFNEHGKSPRVISQGEGDDG